tara:strand:- start:3628 stop:4887 length:1260 start_codon:yes stop_codon:yes gene_type:complete
VARSTTFKYTVTVSNPGSGNKYYINGNLQQYVVLFPGCTYEFNQDDSSNATHPLRFSETSDGTHNSGSEYTTGVTTSGTPGSATAFTKIEVTTSTPYLLYYYCSSHSGMGGEVNILSNGSSSAGRAIYGLGASPGYISSLEYIYIPTTGNGTDFGNGTVAVGDTVAGTASATRAIFCGGDPSHTTIQAVEYASRGNAFDFGDLTVHVSQASAVSNGTRGIKGGGYDPSPGASINVMDSIIISSIGNAVDFGDLTTTARGTAGAQSTTRGVFAGGISSGPEVLSNVIQYITMTTFGNATDFGDLTQARRNLAGFSSSTRGVFGGGFTPSPSTTQYNTIDYITIASTGNATDFGDLTQARSDFGGASTKIRGTFICGRTPSVQNTIDYVTIASTGNATDFGDAVTARVGNTTSSNSHGGLA